MFMILVEFPSLTFGLEVDVERVPNVKFILLEHFRAKWEPVRVKKMRKNKDLEHIREPEFTGYALIPEPREISDAQSGHQTGSRILRPDHR
ncbi:hypothetical protein CHELA40_12836 [Chelatococcus asaccharovorans]|nr:hypothetical protein CHELA40_12836 [Chelatococcus asaccharovorans]CAH1681509.1 hypothetical protein CHELA17_62784 [Chelatococcus asaccharovorans]